MSDVPKGPPKFAKFAKAKVRLATEDERALAPPQELFADIASAVAIAPLFPKKKKAPALPPGGPAKAVALPATDDSESDSEPVEVDITKFSEEIQPFALSVYGEDHKNPYVLKPKPESFVPLSRRGFSESIERIFRPFILPPPPEEIDFEACSKMGATGAQQADIYLYQQFVREYLRQESPYRGLLVYHGLGSGKTCSAIATAEALFATSRKKIVVMTPFSLRKNFLKEITFCGFQHFRLQNFWVPMDMRDVTVRLFAEEVLGLPPTRRDAATKAPVYKGTTLWVPDFSKKTTPNYNSLSSKEQTEIRTQIMAILNNRIKFINYNGISASKLKEFACQKPGERIFDNAVVVIDEVHNLIRLMQGTIEPYLATMPNLRRKISPEPVKVGSWSPSLCGKAANYKRGYLFYRLLLDAQKTKIVALSGTPLINFPEELAILANVLHGYISIATGSVMGTDPTMITQIQTLARENAFIDFIRVTPTPTGATIIITPLPAGTRKINQGTEGEGVEKIPEDEKQPTFIEVAESFKQQLAKKTIRLNGDWSFSTEPLLPPFGQVFRDTFINEATGEIKNKNVLAKRLTGLISYYKGSKPELMPLVTKDEVVKVPFSVYAAAEYSRVRSLEIENEDKQKKKSGPAGGLDGAKLSIWAEVYDIAVKQKSSNYRMSSRQACNFTFPEEVTRPRPRNQKEQAEEAGADPVLLIDAELEAAALEKGDDLSLAEEQDQDDAAAADNEDNEIEVAEAQAFSKEAPVPANEEEGEEVVAPVPAAARTLRERFQAAATAALATYETAEPVAALAPPPPPVAVAAPKKVTAKELEAQRMRDLADCKAGLKAGELYKTAVDRSKKCLRQFARKKLTITSEPPDNLMKYSSKFASMIEKINEAPGSSLVYSQFLEMEGIGIFSIVMDINGFVPIEIELTAAGPQFSTKTKMSLLKNKTGVRENRYIKFTGGEDEDIRRYSLDIFNARFTELPSGLASLLKEAGYTDNKQGQLCRVFCITSAGAEGLSLRNVRRVHIMEPYWNDVRLAQVKGRAVRICSHIDLPYDPNPAINQRTVEVYTYISVYPEAMQLAKEGELKVDESIAIKDGVDPKDATLLGITMPAGLETYVMTSDEHLYYVSERKRKILDSLQTTMKSAAVDCRLNTYDNEDGTFECLTIRGKVGDFLYHPVLTQDILESSVEFQEKGEGPAAASMEQVYEITLDSRKLLAAAVKDKVTQVTQLYNLFDAADKLRTKKVGTMTADLATGLPTGDATFL
jgi:hypothetical protein